MVWIGLQYSSMPPLADWQERLTVGLQHIGQVITNALAWLPNWAGIVILLALLSGLGWYALRQVGARADEVEDREETKPSGETETSLVQIQEEPIEHQDSKNQAREEEGHASKEGSLFS